MNDLNKWNGSWTIIIEYEDNEEWRRENVMYDARKSLKLSRSYRTGTHDYI